MTLFSLAMVHVKLTWLWQCTAGCDRMDEGDVATYSALIATEQHCEACCATVGYDKHGRKLISLYSIYKEWESMPFFLIGLQRRSIITIAASHLHITAVCPSLFQIQLVAIQQ